MKFSLTLILTCLIVFISSCSISPRQDFVKPDINLKIEGFAENAKLALTYGFSAELYSAFTLKNKSYHMKIILFICIGISV